MDLGKLFDFVVSVLDPDYAKRQRQREWEREQKRGREIYQRAAYQAQRDPVARSQANLVVGCVVIPLILVIVGALVLFFLMNPSGIPR